MTEAEKCIMCGAVIPEGIQVCPICEREAQTPELVWLEKMLYKTECSLRSADKRNAPAEERQNLRNRKQIIENIIRILEDK